MDQPHYVILCFHVIEEEEARWETDKKLVEQRNQELVKQANAQNSKK